MQVFLWVQSEKSKYMIGAGGIVSRSRACQQPVTIMRLGGGVLWVEKSFFIFTSDKVTLECKEEKNERKISPHLNSGWAGSHDRRDIGNIVKFIYVGETIMSWGGDWEKAAVIVCTNMMSHQTAYVG